MLTDRFRRWLRTEWLLVVLLAALPVLLLLAPTGTVRGPAGLAALVDWKTVGALAGLMVLSRGLEISGLIDRAGRALLGRLRSERGLAAAMVVFAAVLSAVVTNDVALFVTVPLGFAARAITVPQTASPLPLDRRLAAVSLAAYPVFLGLVNAGLALPGAVAVIAGYGLAQRAVLRGLDWPLLAVFVLMFVDLGLLARLPVLAQAVPAALDLPGGAYLLGAALSQVISNVPAAIFLSPFTEDWRALAWGVSVGGFGLAIGSLANLIALRLVRQPGLWGQFHLWSLPMLALAFAAGAALRL